MHCTVHKATQYRRVSVEEGTFGGKVTRDEIDSCESRRGPRVFLYVTLTSIHYNRSTIDAMFTLTLSIFIFLLVLLFVLIDAKVVILNIICIDST